MNDYLVIPTECRHHLEIIPTSIIRSLHEQDTAVFYSVCRDCQRGILYAIMNLGVVRLVMSGQDESIYLTFGTMPFSYNIWDGDVMVKNRSMHQTLSYYITTIDNFYAWVNDYASQADIKKSEHIVLLSTNTDNYGWVRKSI